MSPDYDVIPATSPASEVRNAAILPDAGFAAAVGYDDVVDIDDDIMLFDDLDLVLSIMCSANGTGSAGVHVERSAYRKLLHASDHFRFFIDVYVVATLCFIGFVGEFIYASAQYVVYLMPTFILRDLLMRSTLVSTL